MIEKPLLKNKYVNFADEVFSLKEYNRKFKKSFGKTQVFFKQEDVVEALKKSKECWCQGGHGGKCEICFKQESYFINNNKWICFNCWFKTCFGELPK